MHVAFQSPIPTIPDAAPIRVAQPPTSPSRPPRRRRASHRTVLKATAKSRADKGPLPQNSTPRAALSRRVFLLSVAPFAVTLPCLHAPRASAADTASTPLPPSPPPPAEQLSPESAAVGDIDPARAEPRITDRVYFDLSIASTPARRIVIGVYGDLLPLTVSNFKQLATAPDTGYANTSIYRIVPGLTIQLGDVLHNGGKRGQATVTPDGASFTPDSLRVSHTIPGIVSMARTPDGKVDSRFFIATRMGDSLYLDGRYAAFGRVVEGMDVIRSVDKAGGEGFIKRPVRIIASGVLP